MRRVFYAFGIAASLAACTTSNGSSPPDGGTTTIDSGGTTTSGCSPDSLVACPLEGTTGYSCTGQAQLETSSRSCIAAVLAGPMTGFPTGEGAAWTSRAPRARVPVPS